MSTLGLRIAKLEIRRPAKPKPGKVVPLLDLSPEVAAMYLAHDRDVTAMTLAELEALEAELLRFTD